MSKSRPRFRQTKPGKAAYGSLPEAGAIVPQVLAFAGRFTELKDTLRAYGFTLILVSMGRLREGFSGGFSGRVGNVVGAHWKDISYIRSMPQKSKKPRSAKQRAQEERLALASHFLSPVRQVLETGFRHAAGRGTGCNKAITLLITTAIRGAYPYYAIDYPAVRMSMGGAEPAVNFRMGLENDALHLAWDAAEDPFNAEPADRTIILLYAEEQECYSISEDSLSRACGTYKMEIPAHFAGCLLHAWIYFVSARNGRSSESRYASLRMPGTPPPYSPPAITLAARLARKQQTGSA